MGRREFGNCYLWGGNWKKPPLVASFNVQLTALLLLVVVLQLPES